LFLQRSVSAELAIAKSSYHLTFSPSESVIMFVLHRYQVEPRQRVYGDPSPRHAALAPGLIRSLYFLIICLDHQVTLPFQFCQWTKSNVGRCRNCSILFKISDHITWPNPFQIAFLSSPDDQIEIREISTTVYDDMHLSLAVLILQESHEDTFSRSRSSLCANLSGWLSEVDFPFPPGFITRTHRRMDKARTMPAAYPSRAIRNANDYQMVEPNRRGHSRKCKIWHSAWIIWRRQFITIWYALRSLSWGIHFGSLTAWSRLNWLQGTNFKRPPGHCPFDWISKW
jgi:hypothetical protein